MPELPEVEVIRAGLFEGLVGATVVAVEVRDARALKRHRLLSPVVHGDPVSAVESAIDSALGNLVDIANDFERRITGVTFRPPERRGKFLWVPFDSPEHLTREFSSSHAPEALLAHLGMSGQLLLRTIEQPDDRHVRVRMRLEHPTLGSLRLDFSDQRLFGSLAIDALTNTVSTTPIPSQVTHIARDPLDEEFSDHAVVSALRTRKTAIKRAILDQTLISGVGNIYADEALWSARIHPETSAARLSGRKAEELLDAIRAVFYKALAEGGTSFDALYVNVNGESGYFSRYLHSYGRTGEPCDRCGTKIKRVPFGGRSSHFCPRCQRQR